MIIFDFIIIYYKRVKNPTNSLFRQPNFKDNNELSTTKYQLFPNFLFKFQKYLEKAKNNLIKEQSIDSNEILLSKNVLNLIETPQDTNATKMLPIKNKSKNDSIEKQSIDFDETLLLENVLNLIRTLQDINSIGILPIRNES